MILTKYNECVINTYIHHLSKYLDNIENVPILNVKNKNSIIIQGSNTLLRILSIIHYIQMSEDQINSYLEKAHMLYIEYTEQVFLKKEDISHSPTMFVYNVLIGNISLSAYLNSVKIVKDDFIIRFTKWSNLLLFWNQNNLSITNRKYIVKNFFHSYLYTFTNINLFNIYRVFETIQNSIVKLEDIFDIYSMLLSSFHSYFIKYDQDIIFNENQIESLCFDKFYKNNEVFESMIKKIKTKSDMDDLIKWIFN